MSTKLKLLFQYPLFLITLVLLCGMLIMYLCKPDSAFSDMENRYLTGRPKVTFSSLLDGSFMSTFETFTDEQIPFRAILIKAKAVMERGLLKNENNGIVLGREGYLFEKVLKVDEQLYKNEAFIESFVKNAGRTVCVAIAPNSSEILKQNVPLGMPRINQKKEISALNERLSSLNHCLVVDLPAALDGEKQIYYKTDHHWTTQGAYYGYEAICRELNTEPVDITKLSKKEITDFYGTFYAKYKGLGVQTDTIAYYDIPIEALTLTTGVKPNLYDMTKAEVYDKYAMFLYGNDGLCEISAGNAQNGKSLIVFKDSYANCLIPFLTYNYDKIIVVDLRYFGGSTAELMNQNASADILFLYNFSHLNEDRHFYRLTS